jgi:hypothetical protein
MQSYTFAELIWLPKIASILDRRVVHLFRWTVALQRRYQVLPRVVVTAEERGQKLQGSMCDHDIHRFSVQICI